MTIGRWTRDGYEISTDPARLDRQIVLDTLKDTYWARDLSADTVWESVRNSRVYGLYDPAGAQIGFCRLVTDMTRFAWVSDVFVVESYKGRGLGKWLMAVVIGDPAVAKVNRWMLGTDDAHGLYEKSGFRVFTEADAHATMQLRRPKR